MLTINQRPFSLTLPLSEELEFDSRQNYIFELSNYTTLEISGEKAMEFLQGQITCNVYEVNHQKIRRGAQCNLKGRILALMDVVLWNERLLLILPTDIAESTRLTLQKTAIFSKVSLKQSTSIKVFGLCVHDQSNILLDIPQSLQEARNTSEYCCYRLTDKLLMILTEAETDLPLTSSSFIHKGDLAWHALSLRAGFMSIYPNSRGIFLPHNLGLHRTNTISFEKGCYKGQEIIARMHYKAKLKHQTKLYKAASQEPFFSGQKIYDIETQQEIGEVIDFCPCADRQYIVMICSTREILDEVRLEKHEKNLMLSLHD